MQSDLRMCRTTELGEIAAHSRELDFNRQIPSGLVEALDPSGVHIIEPIMFHDHSGGEEAERHLRCRVYMKVPNSNEPLLTFADFTLDDVQAMASIPAEAHPEGAL